jgi:thiol-disulfide isomerase/thioredoxin
MKRKLSMAAIVVLVSAVCFAQENKNLSFSSENPKPGDKIKFEYSTKGTPLGGVSDFNAIAYINDGQVRAEEVKLQANGDKWDGEIITNDSTKVAFIVFKKDELIDNNKEQGYSIMMYENGEPVKGAYAATAEVNNGIGSYLMGLKTDPQKNVELYDKEFSKHPDLKSESIASYASLLMKADKTTAKEKMQPFINELMNKPNKKEKDYQNIMFVYQRLADKEAADKLKKEIEQKFPHGQQVKADKLNAFYSEHDVTKKEAMLNEILKAYPPKTKEQKEQMDFYYANIASAAANQKDWALFKKYTGMVINKQNLVGTYNNLAWTLAGDGMEGKPTDLNMAKDLSSEALEYLKQSMEHPANKPAYYTEKQYKENLDYSYGMYSDTYALILWKLGDAKDAYKYQQIAVKNMKMGDADANGRYILYKEKVEGLASVKKEIEDYIRDGKSSPQMRDMLKKAFLAEGHNEAEYATYLEGLQKDYYKKLHEELLKKMISEAAPRFALKDLSGNTVSLDELKGKVVVVDFWATWCGPCKASFPGMQKVQEKYKNDPDVKFVYIDSWESKKPEEMQKNASDFIAKNKYDFNVLLDTDDKTISSYAVEGIPTKFFIDPASKVRFKEIGYDGSMDKLIDEVSMMVDVLKNGAGDDTKKAF